MMNGGHGCCLFREYTYIDGVYWGESNFNMIQMPKRREEKSGEETSEGK